MSVHPHPERGPKPERADHAPEQPSRMSDADHDRLRRVHADPDQINREAAEQRTDERRDDEVPVDTGDDARAQVPNPKSMRDNATGHLGGPGWGSEAAGGSAVDRRPPDEHGNDRRHA